MHFEVLVEDRSGKRALDVFLPKIVSDPQAVGKEKETWAEHIAPHVDVEHNASPSFQYFRKQVRALLP